MLRKELLQELYEDPERFLKRNKQVPQLIKSKQRKIAQLHKICKSISPELKEVVVYTGPSNKLEACVTEIISLEEEIKEAIQELVRLERETAEAIELLDDNTEKLLLEYRYCHCDSWNEIAVAMNYSYRWVLTLHENAIENLKIKAEILMKAH